MKTRKLINALFVCAALVGAQSCLFEQADIFEKPSSTRMNEYCKETEDILMAEESGWIMEYFSGLDQSYGGYTFYLKFISDSEMFGTAENPVKAVSAMSEIHPQAETTLFKMTYDNGPVLSFDQNNSVLHYFATPSSYEYQAKHGDFEFTVMSYAADKIVLRGKRSNNICVLTPFKQMVDIEYAGLEEAERANITPERYISDVVSVSESVKAATVEGVIGNQPVTGTVSLDARAIKFTLTPENADGEEEVINMPFSFTPNGIKAYQNVTIGGCEFRELSYFPEENIFTNFVFTLQGKLPANYADISEFIGNFTLKYSSGTMNISIVNSSDDRILVKGLNSNFDVAVSYDKSRGCLRMLFQIIGKNGANSVKWCPLDSGAGYFTWSDGVGLDILLDEKDETRSRFLFKDNGVWGDYVADSFIVWEFDSADNNIGEYKGFGNSRYFGLESITRK